MKAQLFVTCLVDQFFPQVGEAVVDVLERVGVEVSFLPEQTCCGQPAFNDGFRQDAGAVAARFLRIFSPDVPVVVPSGSCATMIRRFYRDLFPEGSADRDRLDLLLPHVYEFSEFLVEKLGITDTGAVWNARVAYHDSCHLLRELGIRQPPRELLRGVRGLDLVELEDEAACCGFGGLFSVKYPHVSDAILRAKMDALRRSGAEALVANDTGCLLHIGGGLSRHGSSVKTLHLAEVLARRG